MAEQKGVDGTRPLVEVTHFPGKKDTLPIPRDPLPEFNPSVPAFDTTRPLAEQPPSKDGFQGTLGSRVRGPDGTFEHKPEGVLRCTTEDTFVVRAGPAGSWFEKKFDNLKDAEAYAEQRAQLGAEIIRRDSALVHKWANGALGNDVNAIYVYRLPPGVYFHATVVGPQPDAHTGRILPGGDTQLQVARGTIPDGAALKAVFPIAPAGPPPAGSPPPSTQPPPPQDTPAARVAPIRPDGPERAAGSTSPTPEAPRSAAPSPPLSEGRSALAVIEQTERPVIDRLVDSAARINKWIAPALGMADGVLTATEGYATGTHALATGELSARDPNIEAARVSIRDLAGTLTAVAHRGQDYWIERSPFDLDTKATFPAASEWLEDKAGEFRDIQRVVDQQLELVEGFTDVYSSAAGQGLRQIVLGPTSLHQLDDIALQQIERDLKSASARAAEIQRTIGEADASLAAMSRTWENVDLPPRSSTDGADAGAIIRIDPVEARPSTPTPPSVPSEANNPNDVGPAPIPGASVSPSPSPSREASPNPQPSAVDSNQQPPREPTPSAAPETPAPIEQPMPRDGDIRSERPPSQAPEQSGRQPTLETPELPRDTAVGAAPSPPPPPDVPREADHVERPSDNGRPELPRDTAVGAAPSPPPPPDVPREADHVERPSDNGRPELPRDTAVGAAPSPPPPPDLPREADHVERPSDNGRPELPRDTAVGVAPSPPPPPDVPREADHVERPSDNGRPELPRDTTVAATPSTPPPPDLPREADHVERPSDNGRPELPRDTTVAATPSAPPPPDLPREADHVERPSDNGRPELPRDTTVAATPSTPPPPDLPREGDHVERPSDNGQPELPRDITVAATPSAPPPPDLPREADHVERPSDNARPELPREAPDPPARFEPPPPDEELPA